MSLVKTSLLNGIAVAIRMGAGLLLNKILAVYVGPTGYAAIGQLQNLISIVTTFAAGAVNTGVTKYTAEYKANPGKLAKLWRTAGTITVVGTAFTSLLLFYFKGEIAARLLGDRIATLAVTWLAVCLLLISLNALFLAILAGQKEVRRFVLANICGSIIGLAVSGLLARFYGLQGVLVALSLSQAISFLATLIMCRNQPWCRPSRLFGKVDLPEARKLSSFVIMALTTAAVVPLSQILIRNHIGAVFDLSYAGYWDAINKISAIYLTLVTTTLSLYFLPRVAEISDAETLRREIGSAYKIIIPVISMASIGIYLAREFVVRSLFTEEFTPMGELMGWQLLGDVIKVASWLLAYVVIGKAMLKTFVVTEVFFSISLYLLTILLARLVGPSGLTMAYAVNYSLYFIVMYWIVMHRPIFKPPASQQHS